MPKDHFEAALWNMDSGGRLLEAGFVEQTRVRVPVSKGEPKGGHECSDIFKRLLCLRGVRKGVTYDGVKSQENGAFVINVGTHSHGGESNKYSSCCQERARAGKEGV